MTDRISLDNAVRRYGHSILHQIATGLVLVAFVFFITTTIRQLCHFFVFKSLIPYHLVIALLFRHSSSSVFVHQRTFVCSNQLSPLIFTILPFLHLGH